MHDDTILAAIDAALRLPSFCVCWDAACRRAVDDDAAWLDCVTSAVLFRLAGGVSQLVRGLVHHRRVVIDVPAAPSGSANLDTLDRLAA